MQRSQLRAPWTSECARVTRAVKSLNPVHAASSSRPRASPCGGARGSRKSLVAELAVSTARAVRAPCTHRATCALLSRCCARRRRAVRRCHAALCAMKQRRPPPDARLGPLSTDLTQRILLMLPWVDRVRAEGVCRGWLACLRAAPCAGALDSASVLAQCRAAGLPMRHDTSAAGREPEAIVAAALRLRAGDARALRVADDVSLRTLLVPPPAQGVESLCACDVSAAALNCAFDALDGVRFQLPARLRLLRVLLSDATGLPECEALRLLTRPVAAQLTDSAVTAKAVAAAASTEVADADAAVALQAQQEAAADAAFASAADAAQLHIRLAPAFLQYLEADDDDMGDDARVVRCARLGRALARQTWPRVTVELVELDDSLTETEEEAALRWPRCWRFASLPCKMSWIRCTLRRWRWTADASSTCARATLCLMCLTLVALHVLRRHTSRFYLPKCCSTAFKMRMRLRSCWGQAVSLERKSASGTFIPWTRR